MCPTRVEADPPPSHQSARQAMNRSGYFLASPPRPRAQDGPRQTVLRLIMNEQKLSRTVIVTNPQGLHVRSADLFVKTASRYQTDIEVVKDNLRVNGKSILDILMLAATEGTTLSIEAGGADAAEALDALVQLIEQNFGE